MKDLPFACVGTVMTNRKNTPIMKEKLNRGDSVAKSTTDGGNKKMEARKLFLAQKRSHSTTNTWEALT